MGSVDKLRIFSGTPYVKLDKTLTEQLQWNENTDLDIELVAVRGKRPDTLIITKAGTLNPKKLDKMLQE